MNAVIVGTLTGTTYAALLCFWRNRWNRMNIAIALGVMSGFLGAFQGLVIQHLVGEVDPSLNQAARWTIVLFCSIVMAIAVTYKRDRI